MKKGTCDDGASHLGDEIDVPQGEDEVLHVVDQPLSVVEQANNEGRNHEHPENHLHRNTNAHGTKEDSQVGEEQPKKHPEQGHRTNIHPRWLELTSHPISREKDQENEGKKTSRVVKKMHTLCFG